MNRLARQLATLIISLGCIAPTQASVIALEFTGGHLSLSDIRWTVGWSFEVNTAITVDGLGLWNYKAGDITGISREVALWTSAGGLLAQATISSSSTSVPTLGDEWLFEDITPLDLMPGSYVVGAELFSPLRAYITGANAVTVPKITYGNPRQSGPPKSGDTTLVFPAFSIPGAADGYFGPNLRIVQALVPEPSILALLAIGLFGVVFAVRRSKKARSFADQGITGRPGSEPASAFDLTLGAPACAARSRRLPR